MSTAYRFNHEFARALLKALGLEGRKIKRIEMTFDVNEPVTAKIYEYVDISQGHEVVKLLEMGEWRSDVTSALDTCRQYVKP